MLKEKLQSYYVEIIEVRKEINRMGCLGECSTLRYELALLAEKWLLLKIKIIKTLI